MKRTVRVVVLLSFACAALATFSNFAQAQKIDVAFGISTIDAPGSCGLNCSSPYVPQSLTGGAYPGFSGDVLFWHNLGFGAEVFWRASQSDNYLDSGFNFRPVFYNFNAVYSAKIVPRVAVELVGGIGGSDTHILACNLSFSPTGCTGGTSEIASSNHFDADFGGGLKLYVRGGLFVRPEARFYIIHNETDYSSNHATRLGVSVGYTFK